MEANSYKHLHFIKYKDSVNWSVQYTDASDLGFTRKYPMVKIGSFLNRSTDLIAVKEDAEYKQVTLRINNGGVVPRNNGKTVKGSIIGTKRQTVIHSGQFIMSKIDARNGAYGIVPEELDGAIVTNDFPVFNVDTKKIVPQFLVLVSTTEKFIEFARKCSSGTTNRKRIDINAFLQQSIPLPSLEEQESLLHSYNSALSSADHEIKQSDSIYAHMKEETLSILNAIPKTRQHSQSGNFISLYSYRDLGRWDCYNHSQSYYSSKYKTLPLKELLLRKPQYGAPYSAVQFDNNIRYIRITDIQENGSLSQTNKASAKYYNPSYRLHNNDLLIARSGNTVGKSFLYKTEDGPSMFAGYLIRFEIDDTIVNPDYLLIYTKCSLFKEWVINNMRVSAQPNINCQQYLSAPIILPDFQTQNKIVDNWQTQIGIMKRHIERSDILKQNAMLQFNNQIFL